jgi:hypothetical protein
MRIHFLRCAHGNECTKTHDAIRDTFVAIVQDASFHMGREQLHVLPSTTFNSFCQRINNVLTKNGIHTLTKVIVANPTQANLLKKSCVIQGFVASNAAQAKERNYCSDAPLINSSP